MIDNLDKEALNSPSPEQPTTNQQPAADITVHFKVSDVHKQARGNAWKTILGNKMSSIIPRSVVVVKFHLITRRDYLQGNLNRAGLKDWPLCPLRGDSEEMLIDHTQKCQSLTDETDNANNGENCEFYQSDSELQEGKRDTSIYQGQDKTRQATYVKGGSNMTGTDLCVNKPHCAAAVRP